jgi:hypothetical protein
VLIGIPFGAPVFNRPIVPVRPFAVFKGKVALVLQGLGPRQDFVEIYFFAHKLVEGV